MEILDDVKETVRLIVASFLWDYRPLRTLEQEIKRWENTFRRNAICNCFFMGLSVGLVVGASLIISVKGDNESLSSSNL